MIVTSPKVTNDPLLLLLHVEIIIKYMASSSFLPPLFLLFLISVSTFTPKFLVFASESDHLISTRPDPLSGFKFYDGVYDIRNKHYWASAVFTGIHGYAIAVIWFVFGLGFCSYNILMKIISKNSSSDTTSPTVPMAANHPHPDFFYTTVFSLILLFTLFAIIGSSFQLAANQSCQSKAKKFKETIFDAARNTSKEMRRVINTLVDIQKYLIPYDSFTCNLLNVSTHHLRRESLTVQDFIKDIQKPTKEALAILYFTNLVAVVLNLVVLVAALVMGIFHLQSGFLGIIICSWMLTSFSWVLTGFNYVFYTFAEDTCSTFEEFVKNPKESSVKFISPCPDSAQSKKLLVQIGFTVHNFITMLNTKLMELGQVSETEARNKKDSPPIVVPGVRTFCDPFNGAPNYAYSPHICPKDAIPIGELRNVLSEFTCYKGKSAEECLGDGRFVPEASYLMAGAYSQSIERLLNVFPDLMRLTGCSSVKQAFSDVVFQQCKPLKGSTRMLWLSSLFLTSLMAILVLVWVVAVLAAAKPLQDRP